MVDLKSTLPLTSDAIRAAGSSTVRIAGGMHLSVAFALGAALPETKIGHVEVVDLRGQIWTSKEDSDPAEHTIATAEMSGDFETDSAAARVAVFVTLTENADETAFGRLLVDQAGFFTSAARISVDPVDQIDSREAARISRQIAMEIKRLSSMFGRAEIHLAFHGLYSIAILIGRYLNTVRTVVYEWDNPENEAPLYTPVMTLDSGVADGPITKVHL